MNNDNSKITLDSVIKICNQFEKIMEPTRFCCGYGNTPSSLIDAAEKLKALGLEWGAKIEYPDFRIRKNYYMTNSATGYKPNKDEYYIEWDNGNVGRLQFVRQDYWFAVEDEWADFLSVLKSYDPVDYDPLNCHMVFEVENGKRLIKDYPEICKETRQRMNKKINSIRLKEMEKQYKALLEEVSEDA